ncbi:MAG: HEPN domain-containing protein [Clostridia bacterium]
MSNLLNRAEADITIARLLLSPAGNPTNDEMITDQAAYHVQQAIEKALKYQTELLGIPYKKTHNLIGLIVELENNGFSVSDELKRKAFIISDWEASSRYNDNFFASRNDISEAIALYFDLKSSILKKLETDIN